MARRVVGIAYDLKKDVAAAASTSPGHAVPDDRFEEYDSDETIDAIAEALLAGGFEPKRLGGGRNFLESVLSSPPDLVFNIAEGRYTRSREAHVPAVCEMLRIPYTHSDPLTCALTLDKAMAKRIVRDENIATPSFAVIRDASNVTKIELDFPVMVKPLAEGSSMGIRRTSRVERPEELEPMVAALIKDYGQPVLVEEFQSGPEFTVGILGNAPRPRVLAVMEIAPTRGGADTFVYSLEVKRNWREEVTYHVPPRADATVLGKIEAVALAAFEVLGCRDVSRVDVRLGKDGVPRFIEVNPLPGLHPVTSDLCIMAQRVDVSYRSLIHEIVSAAVARQSA